MNDLVFDALLERLLPADEHGPGAVALGVADYVRAALAGPYAAHRDTYERGLGALARIDFAALDAAAQDAVVTALQSDDPEFFMLVRGHAIEGLLGDPAYGGNRDGGGWALIGYPGPRAVQTAADQRAAA
jgi:hypothetical protein